MFKHTALVAALIALPASAQLVPTRPAAEIFGIGYASVRSPDPANRYFPAFRQGSRERRTELAADMPGGAGPSPLIDSPRALAGMKAGEMTLIDVRSPAEWRGTGVPKGARTVTIHNPKGIAGFVAAATVAVNGQKDKPIALICARGSRSSRAARALRAAGFSNIFNLREGMLGNPIDGPGWLRRRLPVESCKTC